jgi:hypothetical protein
MGIDLGCPRLNQLHRQLDYVNNNNNNNNKNNIVNHIMKNCKLLFPCCIPIIYMNLDHSSCTHNRIFALHRWFINNVLNNIVYRV